MELHPSESLKIIQEIIGQRKQKYEENGFFLLFWGTLIALAGIVQFVMLITSYYPKQSGMVWAILMPLGFVYNFVMQAKKRNKQRRAAYATDWLDWAWFIAGTVAMLSFFIPLTSWNRFEIVILMCYIPFSFVALAVALQLKMRLWIITSVMGVVITYSVLFYQYGVYLPLLSSGLACLLFLIPGVQLYMQHKRQLKEIK